MSIDDPKTFDELLGYIEKHCGTILVRDFVAGEVGTWALVELPVARALHHAFSWIRKGVVPARFIPDAEAMERIAAAAPIDEAPAEKEAE